MARTIGTFYEFFSGAGMARAGLGERWRCLFSNDFDRKKAATYRQNWGNGEIWCGLLSRVRICHLLAAARA